MAAGKVMLYAANLDIFDPAALVGATVKCALIDSDYAPDFSANGDDEAADWGANEITAAGGYAAATLASDAVADTAGDDGSKYSSNNITWTATGGNIEAWRHAVIYVSGSYGGKTSPLLCAFLGDATPADVPATTDGNTLTLTCPATGWFDWTTDITE